MPHSHDKARFRQCVELLGGPPRLHAAWRVNGLRILDTTIPGQQVFQAVLFGCLNSIDGQHRWDSRSGRTFADLRHYIDWVSPQPERLVIECTTAPRVGSYLLPHSRIFQDGSFIHAGIPGLRVDGFARQTIRLVHLPTGGRLDLVDVLGRTEAGVRRSLTNELRKHHATNQRTGGATSLWALDHLDEIEDAVSDHWIHTPATPLLSGLMARAELLWRTTGHKTSVGPARRSNCAARVSWYDGYSADELARLLTGPVVGIPAAKASQGESFIDPVLLRLGHGQIELDGICRRIRYRAGVDAAPKTPS